MSEKIFTKYLKAINKLDDREYLISSIIYSAAPCIAGEKPSSLIIFNKSKRNLYKYWEKYKEEIREYLHLDYYELKKSKKSIVVIFYNKEMLEKTLKKKENLKFLQRFNYKKDMDIQSNLNLLKKRYGNICPHEIGIFLGYPLNDVVKFIQCPNRNCLLVGYWRVYNNVENAKIIFDKYDQIRNKACLAISKGEVPQKVLKKLA